jgi:sugar fermentation stimulation protein A
VPLAVRYPGTPHRVRFLDRPNRYLARVRPLEGGPSFEAHVPNPGRMEELLVPGETVGYVIPAGAGPRRTRHDLVSVRHGTTLVSIDARIGNRLVGTALRGRGWREPGPGPWRAEVPWMGRRIDFGVPGIARDGLWRTLLEVKCSNLRVGDTALFPDAPTERGRHHVEALGVAASRGVTAILVFVVQRSDTRRFTLNRALDPAFGEAVDRARRRGLLVRARAVTVRPGGVDWGPPLPIEERPPGNLF